MLTGMPSGVPVLLGEMKHAPEVGEQIRFLMRPIWMLIFQSVFHDECLINVRIMAACE